MGHGRARRLRTTEATLIYSCELTYLTPYYQGDYSHATTTSSEATDMRCHSQLLVLATRQTIIGRLWDDYEIRKQFSKTAIVLPANEFV